MSQLARIVDVEHLGAHRLRLKFSDELVRELDFSEAAQHWGGGGRAATVLKQYHLRPTT